MMGVRPLGGMTKAAWLSRTVDAVTKMDPLTSNEFSRVATDLFRVSYSCRKSFHVPDGEGDADIVLLSDQKKTMT